MACQTFDAGSAQVVERQEHEGRDGGPLEVRRPVDVLERLLERLDLCEQTTSRLADRWRQL